MLEEAPLQSPVGLLPSLDTPVQGEEGGAPPTLALAPARGPAWVELSDTSPSPPVPALPPQLSPQPPSQQPQLPLFHRDECPVACALLVGILVAIAAYRVESLTVRRHSNLAVPGSPRW